MCALLTVAVAALLGRPLSWWRGAAVLLAGQAGLHAVLQLLPATLPEHVSQHGADHAPALDAGEAALGALRALTPWNGDAGMALAHVAAAAVVGAWLAAGERAARALVRLAVRPMTTAWLRLRQVLHWVMVPRARRTGSRLARWAQPAPLALEAIGSAVSRRGPPAGAGARRL
jgi:hypothetical protein